jgi:hypothetical protein
MVIRRCAALTMAVVSSDVTSAAFGQAQRPTLVIMPAQYMSADAASAQAVTNELAYLYGRRGYRVIPRVDASAAFADMGLGPKRPYSDSVAAQFGRRMGATLVVYPQLLAAGLPYRSSAHTADAGGGGAVLHLRVVNTRTGRRLYSRQVKEPYRAVARSVASVPVSRATAGALASRTSALYFQRVAGSRQEIGGRP